MLNQKPNIQWSERCFDNYGHLLLLQRTQVYSPACTWWPPPTCNSRSWRLTALERPPQAPVQMWCLWTHKVNAYTWIKYKSLKNSQSCLSSTWDGWGSSELCALRNEQAGRRWQNVSASSVTFLLCCETPWPTEGKRQKKGFIRAYIFRRLASMTVIWGALAAGRHGAGAVAKNLHLDPQRWGRES